MNRAYKVRKGLEKVGREVILADGDWRSTPFNAVLEPKWKGNKSDFEFNETEIGKVSADYFTYIGPHNHDITALSDDACLYADGVKYIFKRKEAEKLGNEILCYSAVLRKVWEDGDDESSEYTG